MWVKNGRQKNVCSQKFCIYYISRALKLLRLSKRFFSAYWFSLSLSGLLLHVSELTIFRSVFNFSFILFSFVDFVFSVRFVSLFSFTSCIYTLFPVTILFLLDFNVIINGRLFGSVCSKRSFFLCNCFTGKVYCLATHWWLNSLSLRLCIPWVYILSNSWISIFFFWL